MAKSILCRQFAVFAVGPKIVAYFRRVIAILLLLGAVILIAIPEQVEMEDALFAEPIHIDEQLLVESGQVADPPRQIIIPALGIDLEIVPARVIKGYWELSETTASFGVGSALPGSGGNTVVFAHAREGLFLPLRQVEIGMRVYLMTANKWFHYRVEETKLVTPDQVEVVGPTEHDQLTLFTCSGFLDSKRLIVIAKPASN